MATREERRRKARATERKKQLWEIAFTLLCSILPMLPNVPVVPWGILGVVVATGLIIHLCLTWEHVEYNNVAKIAVVVVICTVIGGSSRLLLYPKWRAEKAEALEGDLYLSSANATTRRIQIGDGNDIPGDFNQPLRIFADANLSLDNDDGHLLLSTIVRDAQGKEVVRVDRNHWRVNADKSVCLDKNYTSDTLEVKDGRDHVVLQVRLYPDRIKLQGEWFNDRGEDFLMIYNRRENKTQIILKGSQYDQYIDSILIEPLFRYPSAVYLAKWVDTRPPSPSSPPSIQTIVGNAANSSAGAMLSVYPRPSGAFSSRLKVGDDLQAMYGYRNGGGEDAREFKLFAKAYVDYGDPFQIGTIERVWLKFSEWIKIAQDKESFGESIATSTPFFSITQAPYVKITSKLLRDIDAGKAHVFLVIYIPFQDSAGMKVKEACFWADKPNDLKAPWHSCGKHESQTARPPT